MKCLIFNYNHVFYDGICEVFFLNFFQEEFENIKSKRDVTKNVTCTLFKFFKAQKC